MNFADFRRFKVASGRCPILEQAMHDIVSVLGFVLQNSSFQWRFNNMTRFDDTMLPVLASGLDMYGFSGVADKL